MVCFFACGMWCLADVSSVSPSSEQTAPFEKEIKKLILESFKQKLKMDYIKIVKVYN